MEITSVHAAAMSYKEDKAMIRVGGFFVRNYDTVIRSDSKTGPVGTFIKLDDTLGVENALDVFRIDGYYRFGFKHRVDFSWFRTDLSGIKIIEKEFTIGDKEFFIGDEIHTKYDSTLFKASYSYSLYRSRELELGVSAGLHYFDNELVINSVITSKNEDTSFKLPLPVVGFFFDYALKPNLSLQVQSETFLIDSNGARGSMNDSQIGIEYRSSDNYAFGMAFNFSLLSIEVDKKKEELSLREEKTALLLYAAYYFSAHKN